MTKKELIEKQEFISGDDGSLVALAKIKGTYYKTVNTYPYKPIKIIQKKFEELKKTPGGCIEEVEGAEFFMSWDVKIDIIPAHPIT